MKIKTWNKANLKDRQLNPRIFRFFGKKNIYAIAFSPKFFSESISRAHAHFESVSSARSRRMIHHERWTRYHRRRLIHDWRSAVAAVRTGSKRRGLRRRRLLPLLVFRKFGASFFQRNILFRMNESRARGGGNRRRSTRCRRFTSRHRCWGITGRRG